jgi:hypothetical protein
MRVFSSAKRVLAADSRASCVSLSFLNRSYTSSRLIVSGSLDPRDLAGCQRSCSVSKGEKGEPETISREEVYDLFKKLSDTQEALEPAANTRFAELNTRMQVVEGARASASSTREHQYYLKNTPE